MYEDIIYSLNDEQKRAVQQREGPQLIIAGAGSGKTRVLTSKIALLLQGGVSPENILAITFTKKAAGEMKERIKKMVGPACRGLSIGTFHSVFAKFLRTYSSYIGFPEDFTIYDENDSESCIKQCIGEVLYGSDWNSKEKMKALSDDEKAERKAYFKLYKPKLVRGIISLAKNNLILPKDYANDPLITFKDAKMGRPRMAEIYSLYMKRCHGAGAMDFDDILVYMEILLRKHPEVCRAIGEQFQYILVDEYQDTNNVQYQIVRRLAAVHRNICVVGDDSQSIYAFRGAKVDNILNFQRDYPDAKTFRLETNYRSTPQIVDAANHLIDHNENRLPKTCNSSRRAGEAIRLECLPDDREEARFVKGYICDAVRNGARYSDFAILYRTNAQSRVIEDELLRAHVPYVIYSGTSFFDRAEVKDVLAYFRLIVNPKDDEAYKRICNRPARGISDATLTAVAAIAARSGAPLFDVAKNLTPDESGLKANACKALHSFSEMILALRQETGSMDAYTAGKLIVEKTGIYDLYKDEEGEDGLKKANNIKELLASIQYFIRDKQAEYEFDLPDGPLKVSLLDYLEDIALLSNADTDNHKNYSNCVSVMTSHCSKGLEFHTVFVIGCEEGLFPLVKDEHSKFDEEEERRLFYVSITRAMDKLILTSCTSRLRYGEIERQPGSRFVREMELDKQPTAWEDDAPQNDVEEDF